MSELHRWPRQVLLVGITIALASIVVILGLRTRSLSDSRQEAPDQVRDGRRENGLAPGPGIAKPRAEPSATATSKGSVGASPYGLRASTYKAQIEALLTKLYFSEENEPYAVTNESGRFSARIRQLKEELEGAGDPSILATVMLVVAEHGNAPNSLKRLLNEFQNVTRSSQKLSKSARTKEFVDFVLPYVAEGERPLAVRSFAAAALVPHTFEFAGRRPQDVPASALRLDRDQLAAISGALRDTFNAERKGLSQQLMMLTGPYMGHSDVVREAYVGLLATPPEDRDLRLGLVLTFKGQKWPVYEIQPVFDFMMQAVDPQNRGLLRAVTEAFDATPLQSGDDPRSKTYLDRLASAYSVLSGQADVDSADDLEAIARTACGMDVPGAPAIVKDFLARPGATVDAKEEILRWVARRATGSGTGPGSYSRTRQELTSAIGDFRQGLPASSPLRDAAEECFQALTR